jgi:MFS family permease
MIEIRRPLEGSYPVSLAVAIVALVPFIVVSTAYLMFSRQVQGELHVTQRGAEILAGLAIAGYAFGALTGGDLIQRFRQRNLFLICQALFVIGCVVSAVAGGIVAYGSGRILSGIATGLLLVVALPPVIQRFPPEKLPVTAVWINLGFFGAVCIGPLLGGAVAAIDAWRWFFVALGVIGAANLLVALFTLPVQDPPNPELRFDPWAGVLGFPAVVLPFWASGELATHGFASPRFWAPLIVGLVCFVALLLVEYHQEEPLSPVKPMWTTSSVVGTLAAMIGGGVFVAFLELGERLHMEVAHHTPLATGILLWPLVPGVCITAMLLGALIRTRFLPFLVLGGMACLAGGGALVMSLGAGGNSLRTLEAAGLLGLGAGATVSPGLYLAGFPLPSQIIGRVFALVELVRSLADYIIAPVIGRIARQGSTMPPLDWHGVREAAGITVWITIGFTAIGVLLWWGGGIGLPVPDIRGWIQQNRPAIHSPALLARLRRRSS